MKHAFVKILRVVLAVGFGMTQTSCFMYGTPESDYEFKGKVTDEDSVPIKDIKVTVKGADGSDLPMFDFTATTDVNGRFVFEKQLIGTPPKTVKVIFEDTDGPDNRGEFEKDSLIVGVHQVKKADGWYEGGFKSDDVEVYLKRKR